MTVTVLASIFLFFMLVMTYLGFKLLGRRGGGDNSVIKERCTICQNRYPTSGLIERRVGDSRVYRFCDTCIRNLHHELIQGS